ncbi:SDR family oxidoreductase [Profundibacterium mesophilum]|uniref:3-oxoacyl-acyl-carrier protein reductase n=1 Tax=Profundibacterium mesophilum KAUST100406-0324 TaxID=1037889 RepID=A0A921TE01_9RHOB|nr:SDR family oxidoreductase [Profundibacterium mesophilum]KAF0676782.1 3-oxoacyl-acyl-carrier protein reductase [Profundibacterium mesophilum KAUST100406-0324]
MSKTPVLILGARSDIARACARHFAARGHPIQLAARRSAALGPDRDDLELRHGVEVSLHEFDVLDLPAHAGFVDALPALPGTVICAVGLMGDQARSAADPVAAAQVMRSNFEGPASILSVLAERFEARGSGVIVGISSVAGLRGRASNYVYGASKAGFTAFLSGLRNRLAGRGVHVVTVLPGFVATRMTEGMDLPPKLTAQPEEVAAAIWRAAERRRDVIYVRPVWRAVMGIIGLVPERLFKRMSL